MYDLYEQTTDISIVIFSYYVTVPVVEWHIYYDLAGGSSNPRKINGGFVEMS
jgi:hypothetical protein